MHARPGPDVRTVRPDARPDLVARQRRGRPESNSIRMVIGLAGLASASALATAMLPTITPQPAIVTTANTAVADPAQQPEPSVVHVTHVVTLAPGQTLPPDALINQAPAAATPTPRATPQPTPRVIIQTITRQSGKP
jgi:hypothetical protein